MTPYEEYEREDIEKFRNFKREQVEFRKKEKQRSKERIREARSRLSNVKKPNINSELGDVKKKEIISDESFEDIRRIIIVKKPQKINTEGKSILEILHTPISKGE